MCYSPNKGTSLAPCFPSLVFPYRSVQILNSTKDSSYLNEVENIIESLDSEDPVNVQFTSGTTGSPKGATLSHHNVLNNAIQASSSERIQSTENDVILVNTPFYHCFGCVMANLFMLTRGCKLVIPAPTFNADVGLEAAQTEGATVWYGTPTMFVDLLGLSCHVKN